MKSHKILAAIILLVFFFSSCQKPITGELPPDLKDSTSTSSLVKTYTEDVSSDTEHLHESFNLTYDANNRLISMISSTNPGDKFIYQYTGNTFTLDLYNSNALSIHVISYLNSSSFLDSTFQYNDTGDTTTEKYFYNSGKQLVTVNEYDYASGVSQLSDTDHYFYDSNGNTVKESSSAETTTFDYTSLLNTLNVGKTFLPQPKYFIKTTHYTSFSGAPATLDHTYTFDAQNRLIMEKDTSSEGPVLTKTYTY